MISTLNRANAGATFTAGQLCTETDLQRIQNGDREFLLDIILGRLYMVGGSLANGFLGDDCKVTSSGGLNYSIAAGLGLFYDSSVSDAFTAQYRPIVNAAAATGTLDTYDATNPRIDIICLAPSTSTDTSESINVMAGDGSTSSTTANRRTLYTRTIQIVKGTPAGSPVAPATPSGYVKIAQCAVPAVSGSITVTDSRPLAVLNTDAIGTGAVQTANLADSAVTTAKIASGAVTAVKLAHVPCYAHMTVGAESANVITVTVQIKDLDGNAISAQVYCECELFQWYRSLDPSASFNGFSISSSQQSTETNDPSPAIINNDRMMILTNSSGQATITVTDTTGGTARGVRLAVLPITHANTVTWGVKNIVQCPFN